MPEVGWSLEMGDRGAGLLGLVGRHGWDHHGSSSRVLWLAVICIVMTRLVEGPGCFLCGRLLDLT
jgi:hypothetical protein